MAYLRGAAGWERVDIAKEKPSWMSDLDGEVLRRRQRPRDDGQHGFYGSGDREMADGPIDDDPQPADIQAGPSRFVRVAQDPGTGSALYEFTQGRNRTTWIVRGPTGARTYSTDWNDVGGVGQWTDEVGRPYRPGIAKQAAAPLFPELIDAWGCACRLFAISKSEQFGLYATLRDPKRGGFMYLLRKSDDGSVRPWSGRDTVNDLPLPKDPPDGSGWYRTVVSDTTDGTMKPGRRSDRRDADESGSLKWRGSD